MIKNFKCLYNTTEGWLNLFNMAAEDMVRGEELWLLLDLRKEEFLTEFYLSRRFARKGFDKGRVVRGTGVRVEGRVDWWNIRRCVGQELSIMEVWLCAFKKGCQVKRGGSVDRDEGGLRHG